MKRFRADAVLAACFVLSCASVGALERSAHATPEDEGLARAVAALTANKPQDAVTELEALRDQGVEDATVSFDLGLAYLGRARIQESPGDLGLAAHSFEEAKILAKDDHMRAECTRLAGEVRGVVAKRRARIGLSTDMEENAPPSRALAGVLAEDTWSWLALLSSALLFVGLVLRWRAQGRPQVAGGIMAAASVLVLALATFSSYIKRNDRLTLQEGIIVADEARPADEKHIVLTDAPSFAAGMRVAIEERRGGFAKVRSRKLTAWIPERTVLALPREE